MFDILVYVYEHCQQSELRENADDVARRLTEAGFDGDDVSAALAWIAGVARAPMHQGVPLAGRNPVYRVYAAREAAKLDAECRGLLLRLERCGVVDADARERILERVVAAPLDALTTDQLKLVVLIVLWQASPRDGRPFAADVLFGQRQRPAN